MELVNLADYPELFEEVAELRFAEWSRYYENSQKEIWIERLKAQCQKNKVPTVFILLNKSKVIGSAALVQYDMKVLQDRSPWLSGVVVREEERKKGYGSMLVEKMESEAARLGFDELHLFTFDKRRFYESRKWVWQQDMNYVGTTVDVMSKKIKK